MGHRLTHGLGRRGHWIDMLGVGEGKVNVQAIKGRTTPEYKMEFDKVWVRFSCSYLTAYTGVRGRGTR